MSLSLNHVTIAGNVTRDLELRNAGETKVCEVGVAVNKKYKGKDGTMKESVVFVSAVCWGRTAEIAAQYLRRGSPVFIEGELEQDSWTDKDGKKQQKTKVRVSNLQLLGDRSSATTTAPAAQAESAPLSDPQF